MSEPVFTLNELNGKWRWICEQCRGHSRNFPTGQQAQDDFYIRHAHVHCPRPECGGVIHTDVWGTPIRCPHEASQLFITGPSETLQMAEQPRTIVILGEDNRTPLVTIHSSGDLEYGPGYTPDEAARRFWDALRHYMPARCPSCGHIGLEAP